MLLALFVPWLLASCDAPGGGIDGLGGGLLVFYVFCVFCGFCVTVYCNLHTISFSLRFAICFVCTLRGSSLHMSIYVAKHKDYRGVFYVGV